MFTLSQPKKTFSRTISIPFHLKLFLYLSKALEHHEIWIIKKSNRYKIKKPHLFYQVVPEKEQSGIYGKHNDAVTSILVRAECRFKNFWLNILEHLKMANHKTPPLNNTY
jgi:hypothetical protein